ncbi:MAG: glutathione transferase GstA [Paracoccaceae bacterium]|nr:glutathione transferase GstA [Paracoccaceae bacterium]
MKLYYSPGACSLASHIVLQELGATFQIEKVDLKTKKTESGADFTKVNPKGAVPALQTGAGEVLTEGPAILQFVADSAGSGDLSPALGSIARARLQEALNFIGSELHKAYSPLFRPVASDEARAEIMANVARRLGQIELMLADGRDYLLGAAFSQADAYAFVVTNWSGMTGVDLSPFPKLEAMRARVMARPAVQAAMRAEGLLA